MRITLFVALALALTSLAWAYPTMLGPTGHAFLPSADTVPDGQVQVAADIFGQEQDSAYLFRATYGVNDRLEVGALYWLDEFENAWGVNAKYRTGTHVADVPLAVGVQHLQLISWHEDITQVYVAGTKTLREAEGKMPAVRGTLGANYTHYKLWNGSAQIAPRLYGGVDLNFSSGLSVSGEYQTADGDFSENALWSWVARYPVGKALHVEAGITTADYVFGWRDGYKLFGGLTYSFGDTDE